MLTKNTSASSWLIHGDELFAVSGTRVQFWDVTSQRQIALEQRRMWKNIEGTSLSYVSELCRTTPYSVGLGTALITGINTTVICARLAGNKLCLKTSKSPHQSDV